MFRYKFSLLFLLLLTAVVSVPLAIIAHRRSNGREELQNVLERVNYFPGGEVGVLAAPVVQRFVEDLSPADQRRFEVDDDSSMNALLADAAKPVHEIQFMRANLTAGVCSQLNSTYGFDTIEAVRIYASKVEESAKPFFCNWNSLKLLLICNTPVPESWLPAIRRLKIDEVVVIGDCGALTPYSFEDAVQIGKLNFVDSKLSSHDVKELNKVMSNSQMGEIRKSSRDEFFPPLNSGDNVPAVSEHHPEWYVLVKDEFDLLKASLSQLDPPAANRFNLPASTVAINQLESRIGQALYPPIRALLENCNGQPEQDDALVVSQQLMNTDEIFEACRLLTRQVDRELRSPDDYRPMENGWGTRPEYCPFATAGDKILVVEYRTGSVCTLSRDELEPEFVADSLGVYFRKILRKIEGGKFERDELGNVQVVLGE